MKKTLFTLGLLLIVAFTACAEDPVSFTGNYFTGDPMPGTNGVLSYKHLCVTDSTCPVIIQGGSVQMATNSREIILGHFNLKAAGLVTAIEVRTMTFSTFLDHFSTLSFREFKELTDESPTYTTQEKQWHLLNDELSEFQITVTFIAKARIRNYIWKFHPKELVDYLNNQGFSITIEDLEPTNNALRIYE